MAQICVSNLTFCYEGSFDNIFEDVSFVIDTDWKLVLIFCPSTFCLHIICQPQVYFIVLRLSIPFVIPALFHALESLYRVNAVKCPVCQTIYQ